MMVEASAPANIALIKYMGKKLGVSGNIPVNSSISWTMDHLRTFVRLSSIESSQVDEWKPWQRDDLLPIELSGKSKERYLKHFALLKQELGLPGYYLIESGNNFPSDCGLASSASSFAALTLAAGKMYERLGRGHIEVQALADLSRRGSGSSVRSFFGPFALWHSEGVQPVEFPVGALRHQVVVVEKGKKSVSSSEAHNRVITSLLFEGRPQRAEHRLSNLLQAFQDNQWNEAFEICWAEFWDMHALFETSVPSFGYFEEGTLQVLMKVRDFWKKHGDGPLVTMDAGANVHLLYRRDQESMYEHLRQKLSVHGMVFVSRETN